MLIKNNTPTVLGFGSKEKSGQVLVMKPGVNDVPGQFWEQVETHPTVKVWMDEGKLEVLTEDVKVPADKVLNGLKPADAVKVVKDTLDVELLDVWMKTEKRPAVVKALKKQHELLGAPTEYRTPKEN